MRTSVADRPTPSLAENLVDCRTHRFTKYLVDCLAQRLLADSVNSRPSGCDRI